MRLPSFHYLKLQLDCACGGKFLVVDLLRSKIPPTAAMVRIEKREADNLGRRFMLSSTGVFVCGCGKKYDLAVYDEKLIYAAPAGLTKET